MSENGICPRDGNPLTTLPAHENRPYDLDTCDRCKGFWVPLSTFYKAAEYHKAKLLSHFPKDLLETANEMEDLKCPCGKGNLYEYTYKTIAIDICSQCEGIWFDAGEYGELIEDAKMDPLWARILMGTAGWW